MKKSILLFLTILCTEFLIGQNMQTDTNATFVIANGGLNLRSKPSKLSKKITNIPFGSKIKYLSGESFGTDSIFVRPNEYYREDELVIGNWVKVEYQNMKGYVLDIYLFYQSRYERPFNVKFSGEYVLLHPGCGCNAENLHNPADWKWFGYFRDGKGKYKVEEVEISYYRTTSHLCELIISASKNDSLSFIIGSKTGRLSKENIVWGQRTILYNYDPRNPVKKSDLDKVSVELIKNDLYLIRAGKRQLLNIPEYDYPVNIEFTGDLDGDLKNDFIIQYGDKPGIYILYLTKKAKPKKLIEQVAMFFASYCC